jgi:hypothetical protein
MLLETKAGVATLPEDDHGRTALQLAEQNYNRVVEKLLLCQVPRVECRAIRGTTQVMLERRVWFRRRFLYSRGGYTASLI